jgi:hypothetical protein
MSAPEDIQNETPTGAPMDLAAAVGQLRVLVCGLGAGLILVSLMLSAFVLKQNRDLAAVANNHQRQLAQLTAAQRPMVIVLSGLAKYSMGKPELIAIFTKHGLQFASGNGAGQPGSPPLH